MLRKRFSYILSIVLFAVLVVWFVFLYYPKSIEIQKTKLKIKEMRHELASASQANVDIQNIENRLLEEGKSLEEVRSKFVEKDDLASVSRKIEDFARKYDLRLIDFAPVFEDYFADTSKTIIKALPLAITVRGRYLDVGKFIENWEQLPFYLEPKGIVIQRLAANSNDLKATITSELYSWNH
jgi:Tfp pilus assembly protein PilO